MSVVIPVRDGARFLSDAIDSVLAQTHPVLECIVVDDGSTDDSAGAARAYGGKVACISIAPSGVSVARNVGSRASRGDLIAYLDADDVWLADKIEKQVALFKGDPELALSYTGLRLTDPAGKPQGTLRAPSPERALWNTLLIEGAGISVSQTGVVRREVFEELGGFDEQLSTSADADFACRLLLEHRAAPIYEPLVLYRIHRGQMHRDPEVTLHDRRVIFDKFFVDNRLPPDIANQRKRAEANLFLSLANRYRKSRNWGRLITYVWRAFIRRPDRVVAAVRRL